MGKVVTMTGQASALVGEPNQNVIKTLEEILAQARDGAVQHLVGVYSDGRNLPVDFYVGTGEPQHVLTLIGSMELCKLTLLEQASGEVE